MTHSTALRAKRRLIIFAKEPGAGNVKTRLAGCMPASMCVGLYKAFLKDTLDLARNVRCGEMIIAYEAGRQRPAYLRKIAGRDFKFYRQKGKDLGARMHNAFKIAEKTRDCKTVIIGSDSPNLPPSFVNRAFERLHGSNVVLGPSRDGGYYLIGLKKPCPGLFRGIEWSSDAVLEGTVKKARALKRRISMLNVWYDVDSKEALDCLKGDIKSDRTEKRAKWTKRFLKI